jgi:hypothetical protein
MGLFKDRSGNISITLMFLLVIMLLIAAAVGAINNQNNTIFESEGVLHNRNLLDSIAESSYYKTIHIIASKSYTRVWNGTAWVLQPDYVLTSSDVDALKTWVENDTKTALSLNSSVTASVSLYSPVDCVSPLQQFGSSVPQSTGVCVKENLTYNGLTLNVVYRVDQITISSPNNDQTAQVSSQNKLQVVSYRYN